MSSHKWRYSEKPTLHGNLCSPFAFTLMATLGQTRLSRFVPDTTALSGNRSPVCNHTSQRHAPHSPQTREKPFSVWRRAFLVPTLQRSTNLEVPPGFEPGNKGFADLRLTAWLWHRVWSGRRDSDSRHPPWQGGTLPLSYYRTLWCLGAELNHRHVDFQSTALPTELPRRNGDPEGARTLDLQRDRLAF